MPDKTVIMIVYQQTSISSGSVIDRKIKTLHRIHRIFILNRIDCIWYTSLFNTNNVFSIINILDLLPVTYNN